MSSGVDTTTVLVGLPNAVRLHKHVVGLERLHLTRAHIILDFSRPTLRSIRERGYPRCWLKVH